MGELVTIPNIELISVGSWKAGGNSPGKSKDVVFTELDLRNIMASLDAPDVKEPRMILGHTAPTDGPGMSDLADEGFFGEQPAIGKFTNLSLTSDGQKIVGDLAGVPKWLADILPTAYANRSVEVYWDVPSGIPGAPNHACVMPRVALLGTNLPAVATLEDLKILFSDEGPGSEADMAKATRRIIAAKGEGMSQRVAASVQFEDVRRDFYNEFATEASGRYWWYITAVYVDPQVLIVDDDEESLWSVPYSVSGDTVEFGEPVQIKVQYVEEESGKVAASVVQGIVPDKEIEIGRQYTKAASRPENRTKETKAMGIDIAALRERTGLTAEQLPDDANEEQINSALSAPAAEEEPAPQGEPGGETVPGEGAPATPAPDANPSDGATAQSETITVDRAAWDESQRTQAALAADLSKRNKEARVGKVVAAIKAGKIPPSRKEHYTKLMEADPEGTAELLDSMEAVLPVDQGELGVGDDSDVAKAATSDYDLGWLTDVERERVEAARAGSKLPTPRIVLEG